MKSIKSQSFETSHYSNRKFKLADQYQSYQVIDIDIIVYLKNMGYQISCFLDEVYLKDDSLYTNLMYVKLVLETGGDVEVVQRLAKKLLGRQFKSSSIEEVNMWVQLLVDIRYLLRKEEVVLTYLLSHLKW